MVYTAGMKPSTPLSGAPADAERASDELSRALRRRLANWVALGCAAMCFVQSGVIALHVAGVRAHPVLMHVAHLREVGLACLLAGVLCLATRHDFQQAPASRAPVLLSVALASIAVYVMPTASVRMGLPQVFWIPILIAAASCEIVWAFVVAGLTFVLLLLKHGPIPVFLGPSVWVNSAAILGLIAGLRWMQETGLRDAAASHARMVYAMFHDPLTGLPNRHRFAERLASRLSAAPRVPLAVLRVDIEQFGALVQALGAAAGETVIRAMADEVRAVSPPASFVARIRSDDILVLLEGADAAKAEQVATAIVERLAAPRDIGGQPLRIVAFVGIVEVTPEARPEAEGVLQRAEQAMVAARRMGRGRVAHADVRTSGDPIERAFQLSQDLHGAVERNELSVVYQPIFDLQSGRVVKAEALLRWTHGRVGAIGPSEFIPIAESNGAIHAIGDWVFREAVMQAKEWRARGADGFRVSINRSPVQFREDGVGRHPCLRQLDALGVPADSVDLEITEGVLLAADRATRQRLEELRRAGVALSLDDFGTGYSSIGQLHSFDMDVVKIDRRFLSALARGSKAWVLCDSIIRMAHSLGLQVVAEGIETEAQRDLLIELGCDQGQGYLLGRPMPAAQLEPLLFRGAPPERRAQPVAEA
jgi:diguanylate cyclase (GGDEF)-like protein